MHALWTTSVPPGAIVSPRLKWGGYALAASAALMLALAAGESWINPLAPGGGVEATILWELRLPRLLTAFAVGGLLALAGAWFQVLLGNPLAEPYVLGVAGSAGAGAVAAMALVPASAVALSTGAFAGAWVGILAVAPFAARGTTRLLLAGVVLAAFWSAVLALMLALMPDRRLGMALAWLMGDLSAATLSPWPLLVLWALALACGVALARSLDLLMLGERHAAVLGVDPERMRRGLLLLAAAVTAVAVAAAGTIGFVGLVVPHLMRLIFGAMHRHVLPAAAVGGGLLLVLADAGARALAAPAELPVGVITAMLGVPLFLTLLWRRM